MRGWALFQTPAGIFIAIDAAMIALVAGAVAGRCRGVDTGKRRPTKRGRPTTLDDGRARIAEIPQTGLPALLPWKWNCGPSRNAASRGPCPMVTHYR
jgi:hypothetical protein